MKHLFLILSAIAIFLQSRAQCAVTSATIAIKNVTVIPMTDTSTVYSGYTIVVQNGNIM